MNFENFCVLVEHYKKSKPHLFELEADCTVDDRQISIIENEYGIVLPDSYKNLIKYFGGGYFGFIAFYSFDQNSPFDFSKNVSVKRIKELMLLPVVDLETGDYIGYEVKDNICTEKLFLLNHDDNSKRPLDKNIYEILISCGMENEQV